MADIEVFHFTWSKASEGYRLDGECVRRKGSGPANDLVTAADLSHSPLDFMKIQNENDVLNFVSKYGFLGLSPAFLTNPFIESSLDINPTDLGHHFIDRESTEEILRAVHALRAFNGWRHLGEERIKKINETVEPKLQIHDRGVINNSFNNRLLPLFTLKLITRENNNTFSLPAFVPLSLYDFILTKQGFNLGGEYIIRQCEGCEKSFYIDRNDQRKYCLNPLNISDPTAKCRQIAYRKKKQKAKSPGLTS